MKTFLRTTIFWVFAAFVFLFISGFGDIMSPVFSQQYLVRWVPAQVQEYFRAQGFSEGREAGIATCDTVDVVREIEPVMGETDVMTTTEVSSEQLSETLDQPNLVDIRRDIADLKEALITRIDAKCQSVALSGAQELTQEEILAQKRAEIEAQITALYGELANL